MLDKSSQFLRQINLNVSKTKPVTIGDANNLGLERTTPLIWGLRADGRHCLTLRCCKVNMGIAKEFLILKLLCFSVVRCIIKVICPLGNILSVVESEVPKRN